MSENKKQQPESVPVHEVVIHLLATEPDSGVGMAFSLYVNGKNGVPATIPPGVGDELKQALAAAKEKCSESYAIAAVTVTHFIDDMQAVETSKAS
jgi:hypothetical protein